MPKAKILLVYSDTGGGHRSAAEAIRQAILELCAKRGIRAPKMLLEDIIEESNSVNRLFAHMYNSLLSSHQDWMKYYAALIEWIKPNESEIGYQLAKSYTEKIVTATNPAVIVSVHPMVNHYLARTLKDLGRSGKTKLITVLTDPNSHLWTGWACPDADLTIAPNDLARNQLITFGLDPSKIRVIGMPINPEFLKPPHESRRALLTRLGLNPDQITVAITTGSAGGGNMPKIYDALTKTQKHIQVMFFCGSNEKLIARMQEASQNAPFKTVVLPFTESMADTMNACDLLITKAGALTSFEAIARRLPMAIDLVTEAMPQEIGTAKLLIESGLAKPIRQPEDILPIVQALEIVKERGKLPLPVEHSLNRVDAVYEIADLILSACRTRVLTADLLAAQDNCA
jgi:UDP-N-acetylglucosamine:LPS N-acetylglucosamine transferase